MKFFNFLKINLNDLSKNKAILIIIPLIICAITISYFIYDYILQDEYEIGFQEKSNVELQKKYKSSIDEINLELLDSEISIEEKKQLTKDKQILQYFIKTNTNQYDYIIMNDFSGKTYEKPIIGFVFFISLIEKYLLILISVILTIIFFCNSFSNGQYKNLITTGFKRNIIFNGKFFMCISTSTIIFLILYFINLAIINKNLTFGYMFFRHDKFYACSVIELLSVEWLSIFIQIYFFICFTYLLIVFTKSKYLSFLIFVAVFLICMLIGQLLNSDKDNTVDYNLYFPIYNLIMCSSSETFSSQAIIYAIYFGISNIFILFSYIKFRRINL